jgi:hypothetical protein
MSPVLSQTAQATPIDELPVRYVGARTNRRRLYNAFRLHIFPTDVLHQRFNIPTIGIGPRRKTATQRMTAVTRWIVDACSAK